MNKFVRNLLTEWRKLELPFEKAAIVVAVSGGADSVSLALALQDLKNRKKLNLHFVIAHFNHNLRGIESKKDAEMVKNLAKSLNFTYTYKTQSSKSKIQNQKGNLEQNARIARYQFLYEVAKKYDAFAILTAHTQNDQAETLLLNLIRGSGLDGLSGIKPVRKSEIRNPKSEIQLIRPLLNWAKREDTEKFCLENKIEFCQDKMNDDLKFSRVKIRREIIPLLKKINPRIIETLSQTANLLRENAEELQNINPKPLENLSQTDLKSMSKSMRMQTLRNWLEVKRGNLRQIDLKHLEAIERLILSRKSGKIIELPNGEKVLKKKGIIIFEKSRVEKT